MVAELVDTTPGYFKTYVQFPVSEPWYVLMMTMNSLLLEARIRLAQKDHVKSISRCKVALKAARTLEEKSKAKEILSAAEEMRDGIEKAKKVEEEEKRKKAEDEKRAKKMVEAWRSKPDHEVRFLSRQSSPSKRLMQEF